MSDITARGMKLKIQMFLYVLLHHFLCSRVFSLSYDECRASDHLFISPKVNVNVEDPSGIPSQLDNIVDSPSESRCFSECKRMVGCKSATFFDSVGAGASPQCLLKDINRFGVRNRIQEQGSSSGGGGKYFEKIDGCSMVARQRQRIIAMVKDAVDCKDVLEKAGWKRDGVYLIQPPDEDKYRPIRCKMSILGGGWTIIQRRVDGSVDFSQDWEHYKHGFGEVSREFWLGNERIHALTNNGSTSELIFELQNVDGIFYYPYYQNFAMDSEANNYKLTVNGFEDAKHGPQMPPYRFSTTDGNGEEFLNLDQADFSTLDDDNDTKGSGSCSNLYYAGAGWWFKDCASVNLNGAWVVTGNHGVKWEQITADSNSVSESLKSTEMMVRRKS